MSLLDIILFTLWFRAIKGQPSSKVALWFKSFCGSEGKQSACKSLSCLQDTRVWSLGWDDPLEKEMTTHSSNLAWKISWMEEPGRYSPWGHRVGHDWETSLYFIYSAV